jgi:hypothetical protein
MKSGRGCRLEFLSLLPVGSYTFVHVARELPDISGYLEVHHLFIAHLQGTQLIDSRGSASPCPPPCCFFHLFLENCLLVFPSNAVAKEMYLCLGRSHATATTPLVFVVVSVSKSF